jgi:hypothetical protein
VREDTLKRLKKYARIGRWVEGIGRNWGIQRVSGQWYIVIGKSYVAEGVTLEAAIRDAKKKGLW